MSESKFDEYAILELMGHRKLAGKVSEQTIGSSTFIRIDIGKEATQFYNPSAVYCITPTTKELAEKYSQENTPHPINRWELPEPREEKGYDFSEVEP